MLPEAGVDDRSGAVGEPVDVRRSFSTISLPEGDRRDLWEAYNASNLIAVRTSTVSSSGPLSTEVNMALGSVHLAEVSSNPQIIERSQDYIRTHPSESVAAYLQLRGTGFFYHAGGFASVGPGDLVIVDVDVPFIHGFSSTASEYVLRIPRPVGAGTGALDSGNAVVLRRGDALALSARTALSRQMHRVLSKGATGADASTAESLLHGSLIELLSGYAQGSPSHPDNALQVAMRFIRERIDDPSLGVDGVARALGMSRRNLARVFAGADLSVANFILQERLAAAKRLLTDPHETLSVWEVAQRCGFVTLPHFSRSFKAKYGFPPSALKRNA